MRRKAKPDASFKEKIGRGILTDDSKKTKKNENERVIVIHGAGSFGHMSAKRCGLGDEYRKLKMTSSLFLATLNCISAITASNIVSVFTSTFSLFIVFPTALIL